MRCLIRTSSFPFFHSQLFVVCYDSLASKNGPRRAVVAYIMRPEAPRTLKHADKPHWVNNCNQCGNLQNSSTAFSPQKLLFYSLKWHFEALLVGTNATAARDPRRKENGWRIHIYQILDTDFELFTLNIVNLHALDWTSYQKLSPIMYFPSPSYYLKQRILMNEQLPECDSDDGATCIHENKILYDFFVTSQSIRCGPLIPYQRLTHFHC